VKRQAKGDRKYIQKNHQKITNRHRRAPPEGSPGEWEAMRVLPGPEWNLTAPTAGFFLFFNP